jgi:DnaJ-class molecular chaperone
MLRPSADKQTCRTCLGKGWLEATVKDKAGDEKSVRSVCGACAGVGVVTVAPRYLTK